MKSAAYRARFHQVQVRQNGPGTVRLECVLENSGSAGWSSCTTSEKSPEEIMRPVQLGYQVFDARVGSLVLDGDRVPLSQDCQPGSRSSIRAELPVPAEPGHYRLVLSPVHERVAWFHDRGSEFVEVRLSTSGGQVAIQSVRCMTGMRRRLARGWQLLLRSFYYPLRTFIRYRSLIASMVAREMQGRYRGSLAGAWWTLIQPLLLMAAYYFVFGVVLKAGGERGGNAFVFYFLCGTVPWLGFSEAVARAPGIVAQHSNFVKRIIFPLEILPVNLTLMGLVTEGFALAVFLAALIAFGPGLSWAILFFPVVLVPQLLFTAGLCWFLAALGVFLRDTAQIMNFVLTIWFFSTPIVYYPEALPANLLWLFELNPLYTIVGAYRSIFLDHAAPDFYALGWLWLLAFAVFWFGHSWFYKVKRSFADLI